MCTHFHFNDIFGRAGTKSGGMILMEQGRWVNFRQVIRVMSERSWPADFDLPDWYKIGTHLSNIISSISIISGLEVVFKTLCIGQSLGCRGFTYLFEFTNNRTHNPKVVGSNPAPATINKNKGLGLFSKSFFNQKHQ